MVSTETLLAQLTINTFEERAMAIFDVPGAYLNSSIPEDKFLLLKLEDKFVNIMCEVNPEFIKEIQQEVNKKVLHLRVLKALYVCIESAFLWYNIYTDNLEKEGFVLNLYDKFTTKRILKRPLKLIYFISSFP